MVKTSNQRHKVARRLSLVIDELLETQAVRDCSRGYIMEKIGYTILTEALFGDEMQLARMAAHLHMMICELF